ncbi:MAG: hypothetical protein OHK0039_44950 [Bacteroidia bacterium]
MTRLTPVVQNLIIVNVLVFVFLLLIRQQILPVSLEILQFFVLIKPNYFGLHGPEIGSHGFLLVQIVSSFFTHFEVFHILFNMLALASLGVAMELSMGSRRFFRLYFFSGIFAGLLIAFLDPLDGIVIGASTAVSGVLAGFAIQFPTAPLSVFFLPPIQARKLLIGLSAISAVLVGLQLARVDLGGLGSISHFGHLAGIGSGVLYFQLEKWWPVLRR